MIPLPPTRLQLSADDLLEYEEAKKSWQPHAKPVDRKPVIDQKAVHKKEVQDRIGLVPKK